MVGVLQRPGGTPGGSGLVRWRVLLGAALITAAAGAVVFAHRASQQPPQTRYLVLTEQVAAGQQLSAGALGSVAVDLPEVIDAIPEDRSTEVIGRVAHSTLEPSTVLSESDLEPTGRFTDPEEKLVALSLDPARLSTASIRPGRTVHVLGTADGATSQVATARVVTVGNPDDGGLGSSTGVLVELAVADLATSEAVTNAGIAGTVTLVLPAPADEDST